MSKQEDKGDILPPLQKRILIHLIEEGPKTINETAMTLSKSRNYKPSHEAFNSLKRQRLIKEVTVKHYHGRDYSQFWLTEDGIVAALIEGVSPGLLLEKTKEIYPEYEVLQCLLEIAPKFNPDVFRVAYSAVRSKGKLDLSDVVMMLFAEMQSATPNKEYKEIAKIISKHTKERSLLKKQVEKMSDVLDQLKSII